MGVGAQFNSGVLRGKEAAEFLAIGHSTFLRWVQEGRIPRGIRLSGRATVWPRAVLIDFLEREAAKGGQS